MSRRHPVPLATLTALSLVPALGLLGVWQYADANVPPPTTTTTTTLPPTPVEPLNTPLLSLRRHPEPLAERVARAAADATFAARVDELSDDLVGSACLRISDDAGSVASLGTDGALIPASNQKLLVAVVALARLGSSHRFRTELVSIRPFDGVIAGSVYLVGGGDPVLRTADVPDPLRYPAFNVTLLDDLADQLVALGISRIEGDIVGDGSRYDDEFRAPSWGDEITNIDAGPYDALLVNDGLIGDGNYGLDPNRSAARAFLDLLTARGIVVTGAAANAPRPSSDDFTTLAFVESAPLEDVIVELLHTSDNNTAEMLVKEIGFVVSGEGSREAGLRVIRETLGTWELPLDGSELHDGSGLSRSNRLTCDTLVAILDSPLGDELRDLLPVAGRDGTLAPQLLDTPAEGRLQAKTGTLTDVKALTGSQPGADGRLVDFSLVLNGPDVHLPEHYEPVWLELVELIDGFPVEVEPDPEAFAPRVS